MAKQPPSPCRLCLRVSELHRSHTISAFAFRRQDLTPPKTRVTVQGGESRETSEQLTEYMLCGDCEKRIKRWEDHLADCALQSDGSFPMFSQLQGMLSSSDLGWVDISGLRANDIARLGASLFWRASACSKFQADLGAQAEEFRQFLLDDGQPFPKNARLCITLVKATEDDERKVERVLIAPETQH